MSARRRRNELRLIGGRWRGRKLVFPDLAGLRPTPDRIRETLFNWLAPAIPGARCLDLFAGSGALGLEAASRGAAYVVLVEKDRAAVSALRQHCLRLGAEGILVHEADALSFLRRPAERFDIVFLDPPFGSELMGACLGLLAAGDWLVSGGLVYLETPRDKLPDLPAGWKLIRSKRAGQVGFHLAGCDPDKDKPRS